MAITKATASSIAPAAKGDLVAGSGTNDAAVLAVGANGTTLVADSSQATGLKWQTPAGGGKVLQVVSARTNTTLTSTSDVYADTGLTATITPSSASSTILVLVEMAGLQKAVGNTYVGLKLFRGATELAIIDDAVGSNNSSNQQSVGGVGINYLDTPATTAATTYKTQFNSGANISIVRVNNGGTSSITLMEIGA